MTDKEVLKILSSAKNKAFRETLIESFCNGSNDDKKLFRKTIESIKYTLENDLNVKAKVIAAYIRENIEPFHIKYLSDEQMKELNPLIRNAIYTFLKDEEDGDIMEISAFCRTNLPSYWEDCKYIKK